MAPGTDIPVLIVIVYAAILGLTAFVRFYTEGGFWQAVHTGRTFLLQATTLMVGMWFTHHDLSKRSAIFRPYLPNPPPQLVTDATTSVAARLLADPIYLLLLGMLCLMGYIVTGYQEQSFLQREGDQPYPRKFIGPNQEPTNRYKAFIITMLVLGATGLLGAWYFVVGPRGIVWYLSVVALPAYIVLGGLLFIGPRLATRTRGTEGRPQEWATLPRREE